MFNRPCCTLTWGAVALIAFVSGLVAAPVEPDPPVRESENTFFTESFEGVTPPALPANWEGPTSDSRWQTATSASNPVAVTPRTGSNMMVLSDSPDPGSILQYVWNTTAYDCSNYKDLKIRFWMHQDTTEGDDYAFGATSTLAPGGSVGYLYTTIYRHADTDGWTQYEGALPEYTWYSSSVWVGIGCFVEDGHTVCFDDVTLVGSPAPPPCIPNEGTTGTILTIERSGFGNDGGRVGFANTKVCPKVISWSDTTIECLISKAPLPGVYDVNVQPKYGAGKYYTAAFTVQPPTIDTVTPDHGAVGATVTVTGHFFTPKRGKIYLRGSGPKGLVARSCKPLTWSMDSTTGDSTATFLVPTGLNPGSLCDVAIIIKGMPEAVDTGAFTID